MSVLNIINLFTREVGFVEWDHRVLAVETDSTSFSNLSALKYRQSLDLGRLMEMINELLHHFLEAHPLIQPTSFSINGLRIYNYAL